MGSIQQKSLLLGVSRLGESPSYVLSSVSNLPQVELGGSGRPYKDLKKSRLDNDQRNKFQKEKQKSKRMSYTKLNYDITA